MTNATLTNRDLAIQLSRDLVRVEGKARLEACEQALAAYPQRLSRDQLKALAFGCSGGSYGSWIPASKEV